MHPDTYGALGALHRQDLDAEAMRHSVAQSAAGRRATTRTLENGPWSRLRAWLWARVGSADAASPEPLASHGRIRPAAWVEATDRDSIVVNRQRLSGRVGEARSGDR